MSSSIRYDPLNAVCSSIDTDIGTPPSSPSRVSWSLFSHTGSSGVDKRLTTDDYCQPSNIRTYNHRYHMSYITKPRFQVTHRVSILCFLVTTITALITFILAITSKVELHRVRRAPSTLAFYTLPSVCATASHIIDKFSTFENASVAHAESKLIVHCGPCAACSNMNDITKYVLLRQNLTAMTNKCAMQGLWRGRAAAHECMDSSVGFSTDCTDCWLNDIQCSIRNCLVPCLKYKLLREPNNKPDGSLNDCLACDEKICGPAFIECSGVNRRRLGINSDIARNDTIENCPVSDFPWLNMTFS